MATNTRKSTGTTKKTTTGTNTKKNTTKKSANSAGTSKKTNSKKSTAKKSSNNKLKQNDHAYEFKLVLLVMFTVISYLSLYSNYIGLTGRVIKNTYYGLFSLSAYVFPLVFFVIVFFSINQNLKRYRFRYIAAAILFMIASNLLISLYGYSYVLTDSITKEGIALSFEQGVKNLGGGVVGNILTYYSVKLLGMVGSYVMVFFMYLVIMILTTNLTMTKIFKFMGLSAVKTKDAIVEANKSIINNFEQLPTDPEKSSSNKRNILRLMNNETFDDEDEDEFVMKPVPRRKAEPKPKMTKKIEIMENVDVDDKEMDIKIFDYSLNEEDNLKDLKDENFIIEPDGSLSENIASKTLEKQEALAHPAADVKKDDVKAIKKENSNITPEEVNQVEAALNDNKVKEFENYKIPKTSLLNKVKNISSEKDRKEIMIKARLLEDTLKNFGVDAKVVQISKGPTITRFELQPSPGVKVSKIVNLSDDIALNLAAQQVRIVAPIPGKAAVGIEVPNKTTSMVSIREVVESNEFDDHDSFLKFGLGKDISGQSIIADLGKMPHLLIAGATGSGKSVCVNTIITSILLNSKPDEVKLLMIDPKVVELNTYNGIPHLILPVVIDPKKAAIALNWAVQEMTERYKSFAESNVRDITGYNKKMKSLGNEDFMPKIVVIIDELADLMMVAPNAVEDAICRLAQMARAAGIHLIVATQRPSVDVITGVIKANIPSRIAFSVSSQIDSRTIIDMAGAEKLLGKGDMLYYPAGSNKPQRVQGAFISDEEVEKIVDFVKNQVDEVKYDEEILETTSNFDVNDDADELLNQVVEFVIDTQKASASLIQRRFRVGYNRAARIVDQLEERSLIGPSNGSKPREVLMTRDEYENL